MLPPILNEGETMTKPTGASWIKRGAAAKTAYAQEEAKAELRKQDAGKLWDFWMPEDFGAPDHLPRWQAR